MVFCWHMFHCSLMELPFLSWLNICFSAKHKNWIYKELVKTIMIPRITTIFVGFFSILSNGNILSFLGIWNFALHRLPTKIIQNSCRNKKWCIYIYIYIYICMLYIYIYIYIYIYCVKRVCIRNYPGPNTKKWGPETLRIRTLFMQ